jgi:hypothetical protein
MEISKKFANIVFGSQSIPRCPVECEAGGCGGRLYFPTVGACVVLDNHLGGIVRREEYD